MFAYYFWGTSKIVRLLCLFVSLSGIIILPSTQSRSAVLALVVSVFMMIRKIEVGRYYLQKHGKILLFLGIIAIMFMYIIKKSSADGRVFMDSISVRIICKNIRGVGPDNFAGAYGEEQFTYFKQNINNAGDCLDWTNLNENIRLIADCPDRAYNEYIQIGVEYGLVAMLYFISMIIYCIYISYERNDYLCYGLIAFAVFSLFSYPLHLILFQILFSVFIVSCLIPVVIKGEGTGIILFIISTAICHNCVFSSVKKLEREKKVIKEYNKIEQWYENEYYEYVVEDCKKIFEEMQNNRFFLFTYGRSLQFVGSYEKSDSILMMGAKVSSDPMFWNVMGNNSLAQGKYREAEERYKHAFYMVPNRLYPLYLLAKLYHTEGDSAKFMEMAEKVETFIPKVESVNTERLRDEIRKLKSEYLLEAVSKDD